MSPKAAGSTAKAKRAEARKDRKASAEAEKQRKENDEEKAKTSGAESEEDGEDGDGFEDAEGGDDEGSQQTAVRGYKEAAAKVDESEGALEKPEDVGKTTEVPENEVGGAAMPTQAEAASDETTAASTTLDAPSGEIEEAGVQHEDENRSQTPSASNKALEAEPAQTETLAETSSASIGQPPPPPPRPAPIDTKAADEDDAPRKRSQSSLWDRLRSPADKAADASSTNVNPTMMSPTASSSGQASPQEQRRPSYRNLSSTSIFNSLTSAANYAATSAASRGFAIPERLGGAAAMASLSPSNSTADRAKRLPRHAVDEGKLMEDQMRFAEARHVLSTSADREVLRSLGKELESGWREKLAEVTQLRVELEDVSSSVEDIQDENGHLREQMAQLSEEIARREEDLEGFQRLTVAHQERERELWKQEGVEERERLEWKEREAVRGLAEERAINAQLRLALFAQLRDGIAAGAGQAGGQGGNRLSLFPAGPIFDQASSSASSEAGDMSPELKQQQQQQRLSRQMESNGEESTSIQEDVLFNLNLPHASRSASNGNEGGDGASTPTRSSVSASSAAAARSSSLLSDVVPLDQLRLLLSLEEDEADEGQGQGAAEGLPSQQDGSSTTSSLLAPPPSNLTRTPSSTSSSSSSQPTTLSSLSPHLQSAKRVADYQLSQALQLENLSLRSQLRDANKRAVERESEVAGMREKMQGMEEAIAGLLEGGGA